MAKEKYTIEFDMRSASESLLWPYITTSSGLRQWFADEVKVDNKIYTFVWNGVESIAKQVGIRPTQSIKFRWDEDDRKVYFELKILTSELTGNTVLSITDFSEPDEIDESKELWINQVDKLKRTIGC